MRTADFDYDLPAERIAQTPTEPADAARLLVDRGPGAPPGHARVHDLPDLLLPGDLVVVNDTRVIPARLHLRRATGGSVELLLLEPLDAERRQWEALARPAKRLHPGEPLLDGDGRAVVEVVGRAPGAPTVRVRLLADEPLADLEARGEVPLPPYITVPLVDPGRYQTVYARRPGSVAAPTAGLHLTPAVLDGLRARGIDVRRVDLAVGLDTFKPVAVDDPAEHPMHTERYEVAAEVLEAAVRRRREGGRVVAVGTTSVRALESAAARAGLSGRTALFIRRPFKWHVVDVLLTNFHLPRTTLLMLVDAFVGPRWADLYAVALDQGYRFLSFGDAMLLRREPSG